MKSFVRPTIVFIDCKALRNNFTTACQLAGSKSYVIPIVKSNAYGHGMVEVSKVLEKAGAKMLGVSLAEEGFTLRQNGIKLPILVLGCSYPQHAREMIINKLTPVIYSYESVEKLNKEAEFLQNRVSIHLKIDTGLGRMGIQKNEIKSFFKFLRNKKYLSLDGICSSFSSASNSNFAWKQLNDMEKILLELPNAMGKKIQCHIANSEGIIAGINHPGWLVRPGIMLYGYKRGPEVESINLEPILTWKTQIFSIKKFPPGYTIGYNGIYETKKDSLIALLPVGYTDGLLRAYMHKGEVLIRGKRAPFVGKFSMDWTMVEVGHIENIEVGEEVILLGKSGHDFISATEMAERAGTAIDEIFVSINERVPRKYI